MAPQGCPRGYDEQGVPSGAPMSRTLPLGRTGPPRYLGRRVARGGGPRAAPPRRPRKSDMRCLLSPLQVRHAFCVPCAAHALQPGGVLRLQGGVLGLRGEGLRRCRRVAGDEQLDGLRRDATLPPCGGAVGRRGPCFVPGLSESVEPRERGLESRALRGSSPPRCRRAWAVAWTLRDARALRWSRATRSLRAAWSLTLRWAQ